jgi:hypothetical protein
VPIAAPLYRFSAVIIQGAPDNPGVYALWQDGEMIYLGRAASIRQSLTAHLERPDPCVRPSTHYSWELALSPEAREAEILAHFRQRHGRLPRCNRQAA